MNIFYDFQVASYEQVDFTSPFERTFCKVCTFNFFVARNSINKDLKVNMENWLHLNWDIYLQFYG